MPTVVLLGTLDTKGAEYSFVRDLLIDAGVDTLVVDAGVLDQPAFPPDISRAEVAEAAHVSLEHLAATKDRGQAVAAMAEGAQRIIEQLHATGRLDGALALGGTGGTSIAAQAFRRLPLGVPKVIVSTAASGDTHPYVGLSDVAMFPSVTDIAGVNRLSARILTNAAAAVAGMVTGTRPEVHTERPLVAASMFGVTTPCVTVARARLESAGYGWPAVGRWLASSPMATPTTSSSKWPARCFRWSRRHLFWPE